MRTVLLGVVVLFALCQSVRAVEINFGEVLLDQDDKPIMDCARSNPTPPPPCSQEVALTLGRAGYVALTIPSTDDATATVDEKRKRGELALKVYQGKPIDLDSGDIELLKKYIGKSYGPLVVTRAMPLLSIMKK